MEESEKGLGVRKILTNLRERSFSGMYPHVTLEVSKVAKLL